MTSHPLLAVILIIDLTGLCLIADSAFHSVQILLRWNLNATDKHQNLLERKAEKATIAARFGLAFILFSTLLFAIAVAAVLPTVVKGAMCGTGVINNMGSAGSRVLYSRAAAISILFIWHLVQRIGSRSPMPILTPVTSRILLLALSVVSLSSWHLVNALSALQVHAPSECCAQVLTAAAQGIPKIVTGEIYLVAVFLFGTLFLAILAFFMRRRSHFRLTVINVTSLLAIFWSLWSGHTLLEVFAPYHLGVLTHNCPWCLFLKEHHMVGVPLFFALFTVAAEGTALLIAAHIGEHYQDLMATTNRRIRQGATRLFAAVIFFTLLTAGPAIYWRYQYGVWISG